MSNESSAVSAGAQGGPAPLGWVSVTPLRNGPELVLLVLGEADVSSAGQLRDGLLAAFAFAPDSIVVDLSGLRFCALAGLDALNAAVAASEAFGIPLELRGMSRLLTWMHRTFPARPTVPAKRDAQHRAPLLLVPEGPPTSSGGQPGSCETMPHRWVVWEKDA